MTNYHRTFWVGLLPPAASSPMGMDATDGSYAKGQQLACGSPQRLPGIAFLNAWSEQMSQQVPPEGREGADSSHRRRNPTESFFDYFSQARAFYLSQPGSGQTHIVSVLVFELSKAEHLHQQAAIIWYLRRIDEDLANRVTAGLATAAPPIRKTVLTNTPLLPRMRTAMGY